jgi:1-acyl-sn-glycerol-3-phosphate acyltransferase
MAVLRAALFQLCFYLWGAGLVILFIPALFGPRQGSVLGMRIFGHGTVWLLRVIVGIRVEVRGREHVPPGGCIVAAKHQSAFDTLIYHPLLGDPAIVMKRELLWIPLYGQHSLKARMIPVDRSGGPSALKTLVRLGRAAVAEGRPVVVFPQGTRVAPGAKAPYQPGLAALYTQLGVPVVPVATNSGLCWPRRSFAKHAGTIVVEFLAPIPPGLPRKAFAARIEQAIETASDRLVGAA